MRMPHSSLWKRRQHFVWLWLRMLGSVTLPLCCVCLLLCFAFWRQSHFDCEVPVQSADEVRFAETDWEAFTVAMEERATLSSKWFASPDVLDDIHNLQRYAARLAALDLYPDSGTYGAYLDAAFDLSSFHPVQLALGLRDLDAFLTEGGHAKYVKSHIIQFKQDQGLLDASDTCANAPTTLQDLQISKLHDHH